MYDLLICRLMQILWSVIKHDHLRQAFTFVRMEWSRSCTDVNHFTWMRPWKRPCNGNVGSNSIGSILLDNVPAELGRGKSRGAVTFD